MFFDRSRVAACVRASQLRVLAFAVAASLALQLTPCVVSAADKRVIIRRGDGVLVTFNAEFALDRNTQRTGLMWRETLPFGYGMLFDFYTPLPVQMWMKNTLIPLDMLFLAESGELVYIEHDAKPGSLRLIGPPAPVRYVLEINGGAARALELRPGDRLVFAGGYERSSPTQ